MAKSNFCVDAGKKEKKYLFVLYWLAKFWFRVQRSSCQHHYSQLPHTAQESIMVLCGVWS